MYLFVWTSWTPSCNTNAPCCWSTNTSTNYFTCVLHWGLSFVGQITKGKCIGNFANKMQFVRLLVCKLKHFGCKVPNLKLQNRDRLRPVGNLRTHSRAPLKPWILLCVWLSARRIVFLCLCPACWSILSLLHWFGIESWKPQDMSGPNSSLRPTKCWKAPPCYFESSCEPWSAALNAQMSPNLACSSRLRCHWLH